MKSSEIILAVLLIGLAIILLDPLNTFMPSMMVMTVYGVLLAVTALMAGVLWSDRPQDERGLLHQMFAGRVAFTVGIIVLVGGIIAQSIKHDMDPLLVITLVAMILAKIISHIYAEAKR